LLDRRGWLRLMAPRPSSAEPSSRR
jgi:hypothetical protein